MVDGRPYKAKVVGSSPAVPTISKFEKLQISALKFENAES